jgi:hypothetical protein
MRAQHLHGNVLDDFDWGEYLIFQLAPESKVFIDSRYDMVYPQAVLADYLDFFFVRPRAAAVLNAYPHDFVLLRVASPAYGFMMAQPGWRIIYRDRVSALFARANSLVAQLKGISIEGRPGPDFFP